MTLLRAVLAEAIGSFIFLSIGYLAVVSATGLGQTVLPLLVVPFGFGFGLLAAITIFGHVSGGHFNPAVTLAAIFDFWEPVARAYRGDGTRQAWDAVRDFHEEELGGIRAATEHNALVRARIARQRFATTWGIGETGAAGPSGNRYGDPAGHT